MKAKYIILLFMILLLLFAIGCNEKRTRIVQAKSTAETKQEVTQEKTADEIIQEMRKEEKIEPEETEIEEPGPATCEEVVTKIEKEIDKAKIELDKLEDDLRIEIKKLDEAWTNYETAVNTRKNVEQANITLIKTRAKYDLVNDKVMAARVDLKGLGLMLKTAKKNCQAETNPEEVDDEPVDTCETRIADLEDKLDKAREDLRDHKDDKEELERELEEVKFFKQKAESDDDQDKVDSYSDDMDKLNEDIIEKNTDINDKEKDVKRYRSLLKSELATCNEMGKDSVCSKDIDTATDNMKEVEDKISKLINDLEDLDRDLWEAVYSEDPGENDIENDIEDVEDEIADKKDERDEYLYEIQDIQDMC